MATMTDRSPRILIVTANFAAPGINTWLLDDLADSLVSHGAAVDVLVMSPTAPRPRGERVTEQGVTAYSVGTDRRPSGGAGKLLSYVLTAVRAHADGWRWVRSRGYDLCISGSISMFSFGLPGRIRRNDVARQSLVILWDFFPVYHLEIGRIRQRWLARPLRALEQSSLHTADTIAIMSPANERFLRSYFPKLGTRTFALPTWSRDGFPGGTPVRSDDAFTLAFGGQLIAGRNVDTLIRAMALLPADSRAQLVIAGSGPYEGNLQTLAAELGVTNVEFAGQLDRNRYFELLDRSDVGVTTNSSHLSIPSYPSKIAGYCGMGLPILMAVEPASDYGEQVEAAGAGIAVPAGDPEKLAQAITRLEQELGSGELVERRRAARRLFESTLSADSAARRILQEMDLT